MIFVLSAQDSGYFALLILIVQDMFKGDIQKWKCFSIVRMVTTNKWEAYFLSIVLHREKCIIPYPGLFCSCRLFEIGFQRLSWNIKW